MQIIRRRTRPLLLVTSACRMHACLSVVCWQLAESLILAYWLLCMPIMSAIIDQYQPLQAAEDLEELLNSRTAAAEAPAESAAAVPTASANDDSAIGKNGASAPSNGSGELGKAKGDITRKPGGVGTTK